MVLVVITVLLNLPSRVLQLGLLLQFLAALVRALGHFGLLLQFQRGICLTLCKADHAFTKKSLQGLFLGIALREDICARRRPILCGPLAA